MSTPDPQTSYPDVVIHERGPGGPGGRSTRALSIRALLDITGFSAIDLGCKEGYNSFDLLECGVSRVVGVEIRESFLARARQEQSALACAQAGFVQGDARFVDELGLGRFDLCLCSGLLYHMQNPFNLLKRIRNVCEYLALETHVAPSLPAYFLAQQKYRQHLRLRPSTVRLDGVDFRGRLNVFPPSQDMGSTSGSVVSHATFWLSYPSLLDALRRAGFEVMAAYYWPHAAGRPQVLVDHGLRRSKVFVLAKARADCAPVEAGPSRIEGAPELLEA